MIVEKLQLERDPSRSPLCQACFVLQELLESQDRQDRGELKVETFVLDQYESQFDVFMQMCEDNSYLFGSLKYNTDLFNEQTIARMVAHFQILLEGIVSNQEQGVGELPLLSETEKQKLLVIWNETKTDYPKDKCIHQLFEEQVEKNPDAVAVVFKGQKLTYSELNSKANQLAHYLQKLGVVPETLVGICVERSIEMVVGLLAILKAGAAYVPLDSSYPSERLAYMISNAQLSVLLTQQSLVTLLSEHQAQIVYLDSNENLWSDCSQNNLSSEVKPSNLGYVIYTSGSTGKPKGVAMSQGALVNLIHWQQHKTIVSQEARTLQFAPISFDVSFQEIFSTWYSGGTLMLVSSELRRNPLALIEFLTHNQVERLFLPFVALQQLALVASQSKNMPQLREVITAGEQLQVTADIVDMMKRLPQCRLQNQYGPSESHVVSAYTLEGDADNWSKLPPIGRPIANTQLYILSSQQQPVPVGVPGELYIGGVGLASGYLNRLDLTAEKFIPNPFDNSKATKLYKTGDLCRYLPDGNIEFLGRIDHQVKIRGYRIETGEIQGILNEHPKVKETVVIAREDKPGDKRLVAYLVAETKTTTNSNPELSNNQISNWQEVFNQEVENGGSEITDPLFNLSGWRSSYDNQPIPLEQMRIWAGDVVSQVLDHKPESVWEIGCGTGMLLFQIAPHIQKFYGTDISNASLEYIKQQIKKQPDRYSSVSLAQKKAEDMADIVEKSFDVVLMNSIVQCFPSIEYLLQVIENSIRVVKPGGIIFIGDIPSWALIKAFHSSVELYQGTPSLSVEQLKEKVHRQIEQEPELFVSPELFVGLKEEHPEISHVQIRLQRGSEQNEMNKYRYSVLLHKNPQAKSVVAETAVTGVDMSVEDVETYLRHKQPESICFSGLVNSRLASDVYLVELLSQPESKMNQDQLKQTLESKQVNSINPESLYELASDLGYSLELCWSAQGRGELMDGVFVRSDLAAEGIVLTPLTQRLVVAGNWHHYGSSPLLSQIRKQLIPELREYLQSRLPEYMVPSWLMMLSQLPLSPNNKVDRKALPIPDVASNVSTEYVAPETEIQNVLAEIWVEVLEIEKVGIHDNFFELGGQSLIATQVISRVRKIVGVELTLKRLFESPTIADIAKSLEVLSQLAKEENTLESETKVEYEEEVL